MAFAIKAEVCNPRAKTFAFTAQKTMYGGKHIAEGDTVPLGVVVWSHRTHYYVEIWSDYEQLCEFCVSNDDKTAFFTSWYPQFLQQISIVNQAASVSAIAKALVSFVRCGHGEDTIDEYGLTSLDDERRFKRRALERERERERLAKQGPA